MGSRKQHEACSTKNRPLNGTRGEAAFWEVYKDQNFSHAWSQRTAGWGFWGFFLSLVTFCAQLLTWTVPRSNAEKRKGTVDDPKYQMVSHAATSSAKMWQRCRRKKVRLGLRSPIFSTVARSSRKSSTSFFCGEIQEYVPTGLKTPQEPREERWVSSSESCYGNGAMLGVSHFRDTSTAAAS